MFTNDLLDCISMNMENEIVRLKLNNNKPIEIFGLE